MGSLIWNYFQLSESGVKINFSDGNLCRRAIAVVIKKR